MYSNMSTHVDKPTSQLLVAGNRLRRKEATAATANEGTAPSRALHARGRNHPNPASPTAPSDPEQR
jgi:hypothetical protein